MTANNRTFEINGISLSDSFILSEIGKIQDLNQIKVLLFAIWVSKRSGDEANPITLESFFSYPEFMRNLGESQQERRVNLLESIQRNLEQGFFLCDKENLISQGAGFYLNTPRAKQSTLGTIKPDQSADNASTQAGEKNIFRTYEDNIAPLTPMIAEALKDAEQQYPSEWIEQAIRIAVENNVRKWRYIQAILQDWKKEGRDGRDKRNAEEDYKRYTEGKYGKFIKR